MLRQSPDSDLIKALRIRVLHWGKKNTIPFPWRYTDDPYSVLVSEFMLHRTQARQVLSVYQRFISRYPSLTAFQFAEIQEVHEILKPLGLGWRIRGMIAALMNIWSLYKNVPAEYEKLLLVRGVGPYIAGATVCFTRNIPVALIDTNTVRVIGRVLGLDLKGEARRRKPIINAINAFADPISPRDFYYALIDIAHIICKPQNPACQVCPLASLPCKYAESVLQDKSSI